MRSEVPGLVIEKKLVLGGEVEGKGEKNILTTFGVFFKEMPQ